MKTLLICILIALWISPCAQPKILDHAMIITKAKLKKAKGDDDESSGSNGFGSKRITISSSSGLSEGDNRITIYYKKDKMEVISDINMGTSTLIMDKENHKTIHLIDVMGMKTGFYTTEETEKQMQHLADSIKKKPFNSLTKNKNDTSLNIKLDSLNISFDYLNETKIIAGYNCRLAVMKTKHYNGTTDSMSIWYCPDFKFKPGFNIPTGIAGAPGLIGLELLNGFPMKYETTNFKGDKISVEVKKIDTRKEIKDREFEVPAGYDLKPMINFISSPQTKIAQ